ncbi:lysophospholipid acyltransferase family protein [Belnapia sp. T6]|uniref:Lysophospholipid acyltransferase family protein n=1 Tax=Belnapia mucosa TaxID=2804532 RepID=A0ABS1UZN5_9PROT|nr:lysophospholipid acyltransferase family protein [Belnapia mucosa]MBL6454919.1 lysophospholipid acyltransferase family protein [Belnapia mucosa]
MFRRLIRHPASQAAFAWALGLYLALVFRTTRWTLEGQAHLAAALGSEGRPILAAFWHERLPMMPMLWLRARAAEPRLAGVRAHVLVSRHRDGRFIGAVVRRFRLELVHASSSRGGASGLRAMLRVLGQGDMVVITPDGPRGPRRRAAPGVAQLAATAGVPVLPCAARTSRLRILGSWDRMLLPLPFARGVLVMGPPVPVDRAAPLAALPAIEAALTAACDAADARIAA